MPTPKKQSQIEEIKDRLSRCTIAVATGYRGMSASNMTNLRARLREQGIEYRVIKNTLTLRAALDLGNERMGDVLQGPTALAFGYGDVTTVAKGINGYIASSRVSLVIHGAVMDGSILTAGQVTSMALLPPRDELVSRLLGQMKAPITGLVNVLSGPLRGLAMVLQRIVDQGESQTGVGVSTGVAGPAETSPGKETTAQLATDTEAEMETTVEAAAEPEEELEEKS
jgi:large subunit ribosomal protein L10